MIESTQIWKRFHKCCSVRSNISVWKGRFSLWHFMTALRKQWDIVILSPPERFKVINSFFACRMSPPTNRFVPTRSGSVISDSSSLSRAPKASCKQSLWHAFRLERPPAWHPIVMLACIDHDNCCWPNFKWTQRYRLVEKRLLSKRQSTKDNIWPFSPRGKCSLFRRRTALLLI